MLPIFPVRAVGVYAPDIPCTGCGSLYSRYSLYGVVEFVLPIFPVRGRGVYTHDIPCGVCSPVNRETLLEFRSELRLDTLPATTIDLSGI